MESQQDILNKYEENAFKCLVSNDYDLIIKEINDYMIDVRIKCNYCFQKLKSKQALPWEMIIYLRNTKINNLLTALSKYLLPFVILHWQR